MIEKYLPAIIYAVIGGVTISLTVIFRRRVGQASSAVVALVRMILEFVFTKVRFTRRHEKNVYHLVSAEHLKDWKLHLPFVTLTILSNPRSLDDPVEWDDPNRDASVQRELQELSNKVFKHIEGQYSLARERVIIRSIVENGEGDINITLRLKMPVNRDNRALLGTSLIRNGDIRRKLPRIFFIEWWQKKRLPT